MKKIGGVVLVLVMLSMCILGYILATYFKEETKTEMNMIETAIA